MPSVGMRRTTTVFGARVLRSGKQLCTGPGELKELKFTKPTAANGEHWIELLDNSRDGGGGVRVLRSGKRLWTGPGELKFAKPTTNGEQWIELLDNSRDGGATDCKENRWPGSDAAPKQEIMGMDLEEKVVESEFEKVKCEGLVADNNVVRSWGAVYMRKRKKAGSDLVDSSNDGEKKSNSDDKRFGKQFVRKQWRKKIRLSEVAEAHESNVGYVMPEKLPKTLTIVVESSCTSWYLVTSLLISVLRYMSKVTIELHQISAFLHSKTIAHVYSSHGIRFQQDSNFTPGGGICIAGARCFIPQFTVDFSALPFCFMYLHSSMLSRSLRLSCHLGIYLIGLDGKVGGMSKSCIHSERTQAADVMVTSENDYSVKTVVPHLNVGAAKVGSGNVQLRHGRNQKRSSLRSKRGRPPSAFSAQKANGALASNLFSSRQKGFLLPLMTSDRELRSSAQRNNSTSMKHVKSALVGLTQDVDSTSCCANILVIESDRCYREEGASIMLEVSANRQWYLAIKRDGVKRYSLIAQNFLRPCSCNRFTHAIIWTADGGWKLEFPDRRDWLIFKELYKECSDRNVRVPAESFIPVPGVHEVPLHVSNGIFSRPALYITVKDDELNRALTRRTANYDMDSDDEDWINKFNNDFNAENEIHRLLSDEIFEGIMDSFERGFHCNPDDYSSETTAPAICLNVERRIVEAVFSYWIKKRKQKRSALVRVFQCYQPRRTQLIPKSVLRKKRSFKRKRNQVGRGKQRPFLQAMAAEQDALKQQNVILKVEEAKAAANRSEGLAVLKRQRAQQLMENADLATYKAAVALKIAESARIVESQDSLDPC